MIIKDLLVRVFEKRTGRKCSRCHHNRGGRCCHPNDTIFMRCWQSITRPGYTEKYENAEPADVVQASGLTAEQEYTLQRIKDTLQEANAVARESGLLCEKEG